MIMRKITQIANLFQSPHKLTTCVIPLEILHPEIETKIITQYGDTPQNAWVIYVLDTNTNTMIPYTCITSTAGKMYRIEYITSNYTEAFHSGYRTAQRDIAIHNNPYRKDSQESKEWIEGYERCIEDSKEQIPI